MVANPSGSSVERGAEDWADLPATADPLVSGGVVRIDRGDDVLLDAAWGLADRRHGIAMTTGHRLATASATKGFTALAVMSLVDEGVMRLSTTARSLLGSDLPLVPDDVTVEHLLSHRSGIGDYIDDDADAGVYLLPFPLHRFATTEGYLPALDGFPPVFPAGTRFAYSNGGFVLLALLAERASGASFHDLVRERVWEPAGMSRSGFLRSDDLPGDAAVGYVEVDGHWRTNVHHLPVVGNGDGGAYTTSADVRRFWSALYGGRIVRPEVLADMTRTRGSDGDGADYGLGLWLRPGSRRVVLEGLDAGVSFWSVHDPDQDLTCTVISTTDSGAWDTAREIGRRIGL